MILAEQKTGALARNSPCLLGRNGPSPERAVDVTPGSRKSDFHRRQQCGLAEGTITGGFSVESGI